MTTISNVLSSDHARCDDLFAATEERASRQQWGPAGVEVSLFRDAMEQHFSMEETLLFSEFERRTGQTMGPTQVMRMEHTQMRELMDEMKASVAAQDAEAYLGESETMLMLMQQHNLKEEQMLYPMLDQLLGNDVAAFVVQIRAVLDGTAVDSQ